MDHRFYTTVSMVHTVEELLGLPPMNQNDAYAPVMAPFFSGPGAQAPYAADYRNRDNNLIYQINPKKGLGAQESSRMDFSRPDAANAKRVNAILWRDSKGAIPLPPSRHAIIPASSEKKSPISLESVVEGRLVKARATWMYGLKAHARAKGRLKLGLPWHDSIEELAFQAVSEPRRAWVFACGRLHLHPRQKLRRLTKLRRLFK